MRPNGDPWDGFALGSYWHLMRHAYLLTPIVACGLILVGRFSMSEAPSAALQNEIVVGHLLLMFTRKSSRNGPSFGF